MNRPAASFATEAASTRHVPTLLYLSYGTAIHQQETLFSLYSCFHHAGERPPFRTVVLTDDPERFAGLPVETEFLDEDLLAGWTGPDGYIHRRKLMAIRTTLARTNGVVAFIDSDTYFLADPSALLARVWPGRACLHIREGRLDRTSSRAKADLARYVAGRSFLTSSGTTHRFAADANIWNSGVVGLHHDQLPLVDEAIEVVDELRRALPQVHDIEQFVLGQLIEARATIVETSDLVYHYWSRDIRDPFRERLVPALDARSRSDLGADARALYAARPRLRGRARARFVVKELVRRAGYVTPSPRSNAC